MGHISMTTINKLISKDLVRGLPTKSFKDNQVCGTCIQGKQVRSSFKPKLTVSTTKPLELLHMDLCGPMRVLSRGGKRYVFLIVDEYSRFTWTLFLATKDETFTMFEMFAKLVQKKFNKEIISIRSDHGLEFENSQFLKFCITNGIEHNFSAPRTPQQNIVVDRKNRTMEDIARTMLIQENFQNPIGLKQ